jgi:CheY-like chemotaxis protein
MSNLDLVKLTQQTKKMSVMVVEDEKIANELLSSTFRNFFSNVTSCFNGKEGLEAYLKYSPDIVFLDIIMA